MRAPVGDETATKRVAAVCPASRRTHVRRGAPSKGPTRGGSEVCLRELEAEPLLVPGGVAGGCEGAGFAPDPEAVEQPAGVGGIRNRGHHAHAVLAARAP